MEGYDRAKEICAIAYKCSVKDLFIHTYGEEKTKYKRIMKFEFYINGVRKNAEITLDYQHNIIGTKF